MYALYCFSALIKMTFGRVKHEFGHFYPLFQTYWNFFYDILMENYL